MSLWLLDTDHVSLFLRGDSTVIERVLQTNPSNLATTIVTAEEICQGWLSEINKHTSTLQSSRLLLAYAEFQKALEFFRTIQLVSFDSDAYNQFGILRHQFRRLDTKDLRIAAISLTIKAILITRNRRDFEQIPNLVITDWSVAAGATDG
ncbi:MAG: type II toxin-antitoxin system VapC family toxin [Acaryochloris sp. RU_4_1]|nr:type II toxin-antitoxin system VapC family toxin [Acaryochloris sp. SU_5_25]NJM66823.1 type II toxin-antitoxin system VapC family toxin [Acaryochloris sp. RU_4_1]NJR55565.1 type II toxin-antitoxin system VapC family toxin [Acaryochloris sp. CRU_2_0]